MTVQVQAELAVGPDVGPEQRGDRPAVLVGEPDRPVGEDPLQQQRIDVDKSGLEQVQGEHADFLAVPVGAGQLAVLAVEKGRVGRVPVLDHLQPVVDLPAQGFRTQVAGDEQRLDCPAELGECGVSGVLGARRGG